MKFNLRMKNFNYINILIIFYILVITLFKIQNVSSKDVKTSGFKSDDIQFLKGADVSFIPQIEDNGGVYKEDGVQKDPLQIFKDHGFNYIRLKLWHTPEENYNTLEKILYMANRIKQNDLKLLLNFHYSDTWADPGHQTKPAAWQNQSFVALKDSVYDYTKNVVRSLQNQGATPEMVQIGNEINSGMLWNEGRVGGSYDSNWENFTDLIKQAIRGVRESCDSGDSIKIMIHFAGAGNNSGNRWFFDNLISQGVEFDIIGLSYYPWWHGTLSQVRNNLNDLANRYNQDIIIVETAYPWTLQWYDNKHNLVGQQNQLHDGYAASVSGQASFLRDLMQIIRQTKNGRGKGIFYWAPEYISIPSLLSPWENNSLFDFNGNVLNSMDVFLEKPDSLHPINVKMIINTATHWDTLGTNHFVQIRGGVEGNSFLTLPDGNKITWDSSSDLVTENIGGDYWEVEFQAYPGDIFSYKIWTGYNRNNGTPRRVGWEGPIIPIDQSNETTRIFKADKRDTLLPVQYYNSTGEPIKQYRKPFECKQDSLAIYFRVNMAAVMYTSRFDPDNIDNVGIRGDSEISGGILAWDSTMVFLQREENTVNNNSFWSGVCYIPKNEIQVGDTLHYKFFIENDTQGGWEYSISDREILFTSSLVTQRTDTTIHWNYFDNLNPLTELKSKPNKKQLQFQLKQNYPNPFNCQTKIQYTLTRREFVSIQIYNLQGQNIATIVNEYRNRGNHFCVWQGMDPQGNRLPTGIYFIKMITEQNNTVRKTILLQ